MKLVSCMQLTGKGDQPREDPMTAACECFQSKRLLKNPYTDMFTESKS